MKVESVNGKRDLAFEHKMIKDNPCLEIDIPVQYSRPVKFSVTGKYGCGPEGEDDVYTIEEFKSLCIAGAFIDYDGHGYPVKNGMAAPIIIIPSKLHEIPADATHIVWYNR